MGIFDIPAQIWGTIYNSEQNWALQKDQQGYDWEKMGEQWRQNEKSADNADKRARAYYKDIMSPEAMVKQLEAAGLSPSLMYSGGMGTGGGSMMAQGHAGSGGGAIAAGNPAHITGGSLTDIAQINLMNAEARKLNADADTIEGKNTRGAAEIEGLVKNIDLIISQTDNNESQAVLNGAKTALTNLQAAGQALNNALQTETFTAQVQQYQAAAARAWQELEIGAQVLRKEKVAANVSEATEKLQINSMLADYRNKMTDIAVKNSVIKMNEKQVEFMQQQMEEIIAKIALTNNMAVNEYLKQENFEKMLKKDYAQFENEIRKAKIYKSGMIWSSIIGAGGNVVGACIKLAYPTATIKP